MIYYRLKTWGRAAGEWRQRKVDAEQDGVDCGEIHVDEYGCVWFGIRVELEQIDAPGPPLPRKLASEALALRPVAKVPEKVNHGRSPRRGDRRRRDDFSWAA